MGQHSSLTTMKCFLTEGDSPTVGREREMAGQMARYTVLCGDALLIIK